MEGAPMTFWQAGMQAVCITESWTNVGPGVIERTPIYRHVYKVVRVALLYGHEALVLEGFPPEHGFGAGAFRPLNDTENDAELIARIKNCLPQRQREPVEA